MQVHCNQSRLYRYEFLQFLYIIKFFVCFLACKEFLVILAMRQDGIIYSLFIILIRLFYQHEPENVSR